MLESIRKAAGSWLAKLLLVVLVVSFAAWGISGRLFEGMGQTVATVGDTSVSVMDYRLAYDRQISLLSQRFGSRITRDQAKAFGVDQQVLGQLVAGAALDEQADEMGLGLSKDKLAQLTASDPAFQGPNGQFDRRRFDYVLQQAGMRPDDYIRNREQVAIRQQIVEATTDGMKAPDALLTAVALYRGEDRTVEYVPLPRSLVEPIDDPSDDELAKWFENHKQDYAAPEYRKISYVKLEPEDIADPSIISDEQAREDYEKNKQRYTEPEKRTIEQLVFADKDAARTAYESTRSGTTFGDLVEAQGKTTEDVRLGTFTREEVADPAVAEAAFDLPENEISKVVEGSFGPVLLRVTDIETAKVKPFEEVADTIKKDMAMGEANRILLDIYDDYEDARAGGATLTEAADKLDLTVETVDSVDRNGLHPDGTVAEDIPESEQLIQQAFETEEGIENAPINTDNNGFVFYEVNSITQARERDLDEVHDKVLQDWKDARAGELLSEKAKELQKELGDGKSLDDIAAKVEQEKQVKRGLKRDTDDTDFGRAGVEAAFGVRDGGTGAFAGPSGDSRMLFTVTEVRQPAGAGPDSLDRKTRQEMASGISDDMLDELVARLREKYSVSVNQGALRQSLSF